MPEMLALDIENDAPIDTWFGIGGTADRLARPANVDELRRCLDLDINLRILGDGANLLVGDGGVRELVVSLERLDTVEIAPDGTVRAQAGANLMRLVQDTARAGLFGLHTLAGVPASVGGAVHMNAGGAYGNTFDHLAKIVTMDRHGVVRTQPASEFEPVYRDGGIGDKIVVEALFRLTPGETADVREQLKRIMAEKKASQPLSADSAGCVFKNPTLSSEVDGIGSAGERISAGMIIDRAGCKGMRVGGASVSERHANFMVVDKDSARAQDVFDLIAVVRSTVLERFGVELQTEVVVWGAA
ncbi:MAG: UDP-N-acetylmuramate dehydrogenase [Phycisphaerales bacterium]